MQGIRSNSIKLKYGSNIHLNNILFVPGLHENLLSISSLEDKGDRVASIDGKVVGWGKDSSMDQAKFIGIREGRLYRLLSPVNQALVHIEISPCPLLLRVLFIMAPMDLIRPLRGPYDMHRLLFDLLRGLSFHS